MNLEVIEKLRKIAKSKIGDDWIGIEKYHYNRGWHIVCIVYGETYEPCKVEITIEEYGEDTFIRKIENIKRVPMHVVYIDSALKELGNADGFIKHEKFDRAIKALWGSIVYSLKAYGLLSKGCRIVEVSIMDLAKEFSDLAGSVLFNKIKRVQSAVDQFDSVSERTDVELLRDDAREVVEKIIKRIL